MSLYRTRFAAVAVASVALVAAGLAMPLAASAVDPAADGIADFQSLGDELGDGGNAYLIPGDWSEPNTTLTVASNKTVKLDLNGQHLAIESFVIESGATLTLVDSAATRGWLHALDSFSTPYAGIDLTSTSSLTIDGATVVAQGDAVNGTAGIGGHIMTDSGTVHITGTADVTATSQGGSSAGIGGGFRNGSGGGSGTITIDGSAIVHATGSSSAAGIGGGYQGALTGPVTIGGSAQVTATGGSIGAYGGAGIGTGANAVLDQPISIGGSARVTAQGGAHAAGIGAGRSHGNTSTITVSGSAVVTATGGAEGAGIGAGASGQFGETGGVINILGDSSVTATGGARDSDGETAGAGVGAGYASNGSAVTINTTGTVTAADGGDSSSAIGASHDVVTPSQPGTLTLTKGTLVIPVGATLYRPQSSSLTNNLTIVNNGVIVGGGTGATILNSKTIRGSGTITNLTVKRNNYSLSLDPAGGTVTPTTLPLLASTLAAGGVTLPTPTRAHYAFAGWNTSADGSGVSADAATFTDSSDGPPLIEPLHAQWTPVADPTTTTVVLSNGQPLYGAGLNASVSYDAQATGSVAFAVDGGAPTSVAISGGTATYALPTTLSVGTHSLTASYGGDAFHQSSVSTAWFTVTALPSTTSLSVSAKPRYGTKATLTASVPDVTGGTVSFRVDGKAVASAPITAGKAVAKVTLSAKPGSHTLTAVYSGDATHAGSQAAAKATIGKAVTTVKLTGASFRTGTKPRVTVSLTTLANKVKPSGKVSIYSGTKRLATVTVTGSKTVTLPKATRTLKLVAKYAGSSTVAAAKSKTATVKVRAK